MTAPRLPTEVCERIIDFFAGVYDELYADLYPTLCACCLTCSNWLPRSRLHLYRSIYLEITGTRHSGHGALGHFIDGIKLMASNGALIRRMVITSIIDQTLPNSGISLIAAQLPWYLPNLQSIRFHGVDLDNTHPNFYRSLSLFRSVRSLELLDPMIFTHDQLFWFIAAFKCLDNLEIHTTNNFYLGANRRRLSRRFTIPHLVLSMSPMHLPSIISWFSPCATSLDITFWRNDENSEVPVRAIVGFIQRCVDSLSCMRLRWQARSLRGIDELDFGHNTHLRSLELNDLPIRPDFVAQDIRSISRALSTVSSEDLEDLTVFLRGPSDSDDLTDTLPSEWEAIDSVLASPLFNHLKRIRVGYSEVLQGRFVDIPGETMARLLPRLAKKPVADFTQFAPYSNNLPLEIAPAPLLLQ